ncbi:hypothetical protein F5Y06DRAFT_305444 [Hypoxylon sp. FL0890]|nr:hypothetical protein F5Y06DRAFT_305444 [Hypoxylon sp. FL0890]
MVETTASARARRSEYARIRRRRINLMKKADQFKQQCDAEVYLVIFNSGRFYTYSSTDNELWPPPMPQILRTYPIPQQYTPSHFSRRTVPNRSLEKLDEV